MVQTRSKDTEYDVEVDEQEYDDSEENEHIY